MIIIETAPVYAAMLEARGVAQTPIVIRKEDEIAYNAHSFYRSNRNECVNDIQRRQCLEVGYEASFLVVMGYPKGFTNGKDIGVNETKLSKAELVDKANSLIVNRLRFLNFERGQ